MSEGNNLWIPPYKRSRLDPIKPADVIVYLDDQNRAVAVDRKGNLVAGPDSDHASVIQAAIDYVYNTYGGGKVFLDTGIYELSKPVNLKSNIMLLGSSPDRTILRLKIGVVGNVIQAIGTTTNPLVNVVVGMLTADGRYPDNPRVGTAATEDERNQNAVSFQYVENGTVFNAKLINSPWNNLQFYECRKCFAFNVHADNSGWKGLQMWSNVEDSAFIGCASYNAAGDDIVLEIVKNALVLGCIAGRNIRTVLQYNYEVAIVGNKAGLILIQQTKGAVVSDNVIENSGTSEAIRIEDSNGVLVIGNEIRNSGPLTVADTARNVLVVGNVVRDSTSISIAINGNNVVVASNTIYGGVYSGIAIYGSDVFVGANHIDSPGKDGIYVKNTSKVNIIGNYIINPSRNGIWIGGDGGPCSHIQVYGNYVTNPVNHGIYCYVSKRCAIKNNFVYEVQQYTDGIRLEGTSTNPADDNVVEGNIILTDALPNHSGIRLTGYGSRNIILNNHIDGPWYILINIESNTITDTRIMYNYLLGMPRSGNILVVNDPSAILRNNVGYITENVGVSTTSGDGVNTDFLLGTHGLSPNITDPTKVIVKCTPASADAIAASPVVCYLSDEDADGVYESIRAKFASAPAAGTNNVAVAWEAEYIG